MYTLLELRPSSTSSNGKSSSASLSGSLSPITSSISASDSISSVCKWCETAGPGAIWRGKLNLSSSGGRGSVCNLHNSRKSISTLKLFEKKKIKYYWKKNVNYIIRHQLTWFITWLLVPFVLHKIWTAFVTLLSSLSANHTGGVEGYVSWKENDLKNYL